MKRAVAILNLAVCAYLVCGCLTRNNPEKEVVFEAVDTTVVVSPFNKVLGEALDQCFAYIESREFSTPAKEDIFHIQFYNQKGKCFVSIFTQPFYFKERVVGYNVRNGYTVVFNRSESTCAHLFVDPDKLIPYRDTIPGFVDVYDMPRGSYEPYGLKLEIIDQDSMEVIYEGML